MKHIVSLTLLFFTLISHSGETNVDRETERKVDCLAKNMYFEAKGESRRGQLAVAHVTINRTHSSAYPSKICDVVYQKNQFSWTNTKARIRDFTHYEQIRRLAYDVIQGKTKDPTRGALSFHNNQVNPRWNKPPKVRIGNHIFY